MRKRSRRTMGKSTGSSGRCRPQTLQRFLSLGFNSMLPACHSDLRSVPVIRTAFRAGPKHQSCLIVGRWREGWGGQWVGGGDAETWRGIWADEVHFQIDTGALHSHIFAPTAQVDRWGTGGAGGREEGKGEDHLSGKAFFKSSLHKFLFPLTLLTQRVSGEGGYFGWQQSHVTRAFCKRGWRWQTNLQASSSSWQHLTHVHVLVLIYTLATSIVLRKKKKYGTMRGEDIIWSVPDGTTCNVKM